MEQLYRRHYQTVYRYALRLTGSEHAAEELAAETFTGPWWPCRISGASAPPPPGCARSPGTPDLSAAGRKAGASPWMTPPSCRTAGLCRRLEDKDLASRIHRLHRLRSRTGEVFLLRVLGELSFRDIGSLFEKGGSGPASPITGPGRKSWSKWEERHENHRLCLGPKI